MVLFGGGGGGEHKKISMLFSKVVNGPSPAELKLRDKNVSGYQLGSITWAAFQGKVFIFISQNEGGSKDHKIIGKALGIEKIVIQFYTDHINLKALETLFFREILWKLPVA